MDLRVGEFKFHFYKIRLMPFLISLFLVINMVEASTYKCETYFGEVVPLKLEKFTNKKREIINKWNQDSFKNRLNKSKEKIKSSPPYELTTRYGLQKAESFKFDLTCEQYNKCELFFRDQSNKVITSKRHILKISVPKLYNQKDGQVTGYVEAQITRRKYKGLLFRIYKRYEGYQRSGSGEIKLFNEEKLLSMDVGIDEQFALDQTRSLRLATLEFKLECEKLNP